MKYLYFLLFGIASFFTASSQCPAAGIVWYVKKNAAAGGAGTSWSCAFQNVQQAIDAASSGQEVWVAAGTYLPTKDPFGNAFPTNPRTKTFYLENGVKIFGGFAGTENLRTQRNFTNNVTVLSGDLNGNDNGFTNNGENAYQVVLSLSDGTGTEIDGFTIKGGNADLNDDITLESFSHGYTKGGGICSERSLLKVTNCIVSGNSAFLYGSGIYSGLVSTTISNCTFTGNKSQSAGGGGISYYQSNGTLNNSTFSGNIAGSGGGGAIFNNLSSPSITNCLFLGNSASGGGGMANFNTSSPAITNCIFLGNSSTHGGGMFNLLNSSPIIINCSFSGNIASGGGGCVYNLTTCFPVIKNSVLWGNSSITFSQDAVSTTTINYSIVQGGFTGTGNLSDNPVFVNQPVTGLGTSGDLHIQGCSPAIDAATSTSAPTTDIDGNSRPAHAGYDMGAYEFQGTLSASILYYQDADGDGFGNPGVTKLFCQGSSSLTGYVSNNTDCNDNSAIQKPGQVWYKDSDDDDYGATGAGSLTQCLRPTGYKAASELTATTGDCNDGNGAVYPGAVEICDGIDNNCNGSTDEGVTTTFYRDADGDGFGNASVTTQGCSAPTGYVSNSTDCNDNSAIQKPGQVWYKDSDDDDYGATGAGSLTQCLRPTGYKAASELTATTGDCNDGNGAVYPSAVEICDGIDNNCNGSTDEGVTITFYRDADGDGFGNASVTIQACSAPTGYVSNNTDCNDNSAIQKPGQVWYKDSDNDDYGATGAGSLAQCLRPTGYKAASELTATTGDCNDGNGAVHPGAVEICDGIDNNCNGSTDEGVTITFYRDADGDGFGNASVTIQACSAPTGYVSNNTDCNDNSAIQKPGQVWYKDSDNDDYGATGAGSLAQCLRPTGYKAASELTATTGDCNDGNGAVHPGAVEICDGIDNNCNGSTDEGVTTTFYRDADGDGFGDAAHTTQACAKPSGYVSNNTDSEDDDDTIYPGAPEICDGKDNNGNGQIDEGVKTTWYRDTDNDGFGDAAHTTQACAKPSGYVSNNTDSEDDDDTIYPGAPEICDGKDNNGNGQIDEGVKTTWYRDSDGDGFGDAAHSTQACAKPSGYVSNNTDSEDDDDTIYPGAPEICDGKDNNGNGQIDEGVKTTWYRDTDIDGFGDAAHTTQACSKPSGYVGNNTDCDDSDDTIYPGAPEVDDNKDNNCNGQIDEGLNTYYRDADGDGYGDAAHTMQATSQPPGYVSNSTDCNDNPATGGAAVHPGAPEVCDGIDNNCNGQIDEGVKTTWYRDSDGDGFGDAAHSTQACAKPSGYVSNNTDSEDDDDTIYPGAPEICDGKDNNGNGQIDEGVKTTWYRDSDADGFGDAAHTTQACAKPSGYVSNNTDSEDDDDTIYPGAPEICDGKDNNGNGQIDEGVKTTYYRDFDKDGFGDVTKTTLACSAPSGYVSNNTDSEDDDDTIYPGAPEICDGKDNNGNGQIDEGVKATWYRDTDNDGFGNAAHSTQACSKPSGYVSNNIDSEDDDDTIYPGAPEICDGKDNNGNGQIDEGVKTTWYRDTDIDGFGDAAHTTQACSKPSGYVGNNTDCDDSDDTIYPGAPEVDDNKDNNCNGQIDEGLNTYYRDADGDGYGDAAHTMQATSQPPGYVSNSTDCNDNPATGGAAVHPGAPEVCDGIDNNCNGQIDEGVKTTWYRDSDGDGFGDAAHSTQACAKPSGYVSNNTDSEDDDDTIYPGAPEICDGKDNNGNGQIDEGVKTTWYRDSDADGFGDAAHTTQACAKPSGYVSNNTDSEDDDDTIYPGAPEICDGKDNNGNGQIDEGVKTTYYRDFDKDGFGDVTKTTLACSAPSGYVSNNTDSEDDDDTIYPGAPEICDGKDNNGNGQIDEGVKATWYRDTDNDGFGNAAHSTQACSKPSGYVSNNTDCDDSDDTIYPGAPEIDDNKDNNCNGQIDEGLNTYYQDADGDGYGDAAHTTQATSQPPGYVSNSTDCNDDPATGGAAVHPGATEVCDGIDNNCNGQIDEGLKTTWYRDADKDGFGDPANTTQACSAPAGYVSDNTDCDDNDDTVYPAAAEVCDGKDNNCNSQIDEGVLTVYYRDVDKDGFGDPAHTTQACVTLPGYVSNNTDGDDDDDTVYPGAPELCDGKDNNSNGQTDEGVKTTWYRDADDDGFGDPAESTQACTLPPGYINSNTDEDDDDNTVYPGAPELCDGKDNNGNGQIDEGVKATWYRDADGDGFGDAGETTQACAKPPGYVSNNTDCDDDPAQGGTVYPGAPEVTDGKDNNCNGQVDETGITTYYRDADKDGFGDATDTKEASTQPSGYVADNRDPDDKDDTVYPGAPELCDGKDNNGNGQIDEGVKTTWYRDADVDGFGDAAKTTQACIQPPGYVSNKTDGDDNPATGGTVYPGAPELCDGRDNNGNGQIDEGLKTTWYRDADVDGFGDAAKTTQACVQPPGYVANSTDCKDNDKTIYPDAPEVRDSKDNNCNGQIDEGVKITYYRDADGDGYGNVALTTQASFQPPGYACNNLDCNDNPAQGGEAIHPGATEVLDNKDNNCDGRTDEGFTKKSYYKDYDKDGYGDPGKSILTSGPCPAGYVTNNKDCNDNPAQGGASIHPGAPELLDNKDNNCDGRTDEGFTKKSYYKDYDKDGYGDPGKSILTSGPCPAGYVTNNKDCNDNSKAIHPGAPELLDNKDNNCDGRIDEGFTKKTYYKDNDKDGYGDPGKSIVTTGSCPAGYVTNNRDCNDNNKKVYPGAAEIAGNKIDDNCNGKVDEKPVKARGSSDEVIADESKDLVKVNVLPNPSSNYFVVNIKGSRDKPVHLRVVDMAGRLLEVKGNVAANSTLAIGHNYRPGIYLLEVIQGSERVVIKCIKQ